MKIYDKILAHIPHSSIADYSYGWLSSARMFPIVKRLTDWHTELLFSSSNPKVDAMIFPHSRFYLDVERLDNDPMEEIGQGKIYTKYDNFKRNLLSENDIATLNGIYRAWKEECAKHITANTLVVDCHAFPSDVCADVDVCIGFNEDSSKPETETLEFIKGYFEELGFRTEYNKPYSNSVVFNDRHHSLMLEINKAAYMYEDTLEMRPDAYMIGNAIHKIYDVLTANTQKTLLDRMDNL